jgi:hypothetical protein
MVDKPDYFTDKEWAEWIKDHPDLEDKVVHLDQTKRKPKKPPPAPGDRPGWLANAVIDEKGRIVSNVANTLLSLRGAPELAGVLAYDELLRATVLVKDLPLTANAQHASRDPLPRPVVDEDVTQIQEWIQWNGLATIGREIVHQAIDRRGREFPFHRLRDWLANLRWDGEKRLDRWLTDYLGAEASRYHATIGKMFLIAMVARVFQPGCQADYVLILQGEQGELKSTICRVLAGEYFSDNIPDIRSKDAAQYVRGLWLIELPELSALSRADIEAWKAFITRTTERYRPFYGHRETIEPRQCLFIGTTNRSEYLHDETGNRRFWPVRIGEIDLDGLIYSREQLFAEAVHCYRAQERWWPEREFERESIEPEQEAAFEVDVWEPVIANWLHETTRNKVLVSEVGTLALSFLSASQIHTADARRIRGILHRLHWRQPRRGERFYHRPGTGNDANEDDYSAWIFARCEIVDGAWSRSSELFASWRAWAEQAEQHAGDTKRFREKLELLGYPHRHVETGNFYVGLRIRRAAPETADGK